MKNKEVRVKMVGDIVKFPEIKVEKKKKEKVVRERTLEEHVAYLLENKKQLTRESGIYCFLYQKKIVYIGQTSDLRARIYGHLRPSKLKSALHDQKQVSFYSFIDRFREDDELRFGILEYCPLNKLNSREKYYIKNIDLLIIIVVLKVSIKRYIGK